VRSVEGQKGSKKWGKKSFSTILDVRCLKVFPSTSADVVNGLMWRDFIGKIEW
jgi:hypothetical protein